MSTNVGRGVRQTYRCDDDDDDLDDILPKTSKSSRLSTLFDDPHIPNSAVTDESKSSLRFVPPKQPRPGVSVKPNLNMTDSNCSTPVNTLGTDGEACKMRDASNPVLLAAKVEAFFWKDEAFSSLGQAVCCILAGRGSSAVVYTLLLYHNPKQPLSRVSINEKFVVTIQSNDCFCFSDSHGKWWSIKASPELQIDILKQLGACRALCATRALTFQSLTPVSTATHNDTAAELSAGDWAEVTLREVVVTSGGVFDRQPCSSEAGQVLRVCVSPSSESSSWQAGLVGARRGDRRIVLILQKDSNHLTGYDVTIEKVKKRKPPSQSSTPTPTVAVATRASNSPAPHLGGIVPKEQGPALQEKEADDSRAAVLSRIARLGQSVFGAVGHSLQDTAASGVAKDTNTAGAAGAVADTVTDGLVIGSGAAGILAQAGVDEHRENEGVNAFRDVTHSEAGMEWDSPVSQEQSLPSVHHCTAFQPIRTRPLVTPAKPGSSDNRSGRSNINENVYNNTGDGSDTVGQHMPYLNQDINNLGLQQPFCNQQQLQHGLGTESHQFQQMGSFVSPVQSYHSNKLYPYASSPYPLHAQSLSVQQGSVALHYGTAPMYPMGAQVQHHPRPAYHLPAQVQHGTAPLSHALTATHLSTAPLPHGSAPVQQADPTLSLLFSESRAQNTELRIALAKMADQVTDMQYKITDLSDKGRCLAGVDTDAANVLYAGLESRLDAVFAEQRQREAAAAGAVAHLCHLVTSLQQLLPDGETYSEGAQASGEVLVTQTSGEASNYLRGMKDLSHEERIRSSVAALERMIAWTKEGKFAYLDRPKVVSANVMASGTLDGGDAEGMVDECQHKENDLSIRIKTLNDYVASINSKLHDAQSKLSKYDVWEESCNSLHRKWQECRGDAEFLDLTEQCSVVAGDLTAEPEWLQTYREVQTACQRMREQVKSVKQEKEQLRYQKDRLQQQEMRVTHERDQMKLENLKLLQENSNLMEKINSLLDNSVTLQQEIAVLKTQHESKVLNHSSVQTCGSAMETEREIYEKQKEEEASQMLEEKISQIELENRELLQRWEQSQVQVETVTHKYNELVNVYKKLLLELCPNEVAHKMDDNIAAYDTQIINRVSLLKETKQENAVLHLTINELREDLAKCGSGNNNKREQIQQQGSEAHARKDIKDSEVYQHIKRVEREDYLVTGGHVHNNINPEEGAHSTTREDELCRLEAEASDLRSQLQHTRLELDRLVVERQKEQQERNEQLAGLNESRAEVESELQELCGAQQSMEQEVRALRQQAQHLKRLAHHRRQGGGSNSDEDGVPSGVVTPTERVSSSTQTTHDDDADGVRLNAHQTVEATATGVVVEDHKEVVSVALKHAMNVVYREAKALFGAEDHYDGDTVRRLLLSVIKDTTLQYLASMKEDNERAAPVLPHTEHYSSHCATDTVDKRNLNRLLGSTDSNKQLQEESESWSTRSSVHYNGGDRPAVGEVSLQVTTGEQQRCAHGDDEGAAGQACEHRPGTTDNDASSDDRSVEDSSPSGEYDVTDDSEGCAASLVEDVSEVPAEVATSHVEDVSEVTAEVADTLVEAASATTLEAVKEDGLRGDGEYECLVSTESKHRTEKFIKEESNQFVGSNAGEQNKVGLLDEVGNTLQPHFEQRGSDLSYGENLLKQNKEVLRNLLEVSGHKQTIQNKSSRHLEEQKQKDQVWHLGSQPPPLPPLFPVEDEEEDGDGWLF